MPEVPDGVFEIIDGRPYVMGRHVAWAHVVVSSDSDYTEVIGYVWHERGFHVKTENGFILSTMWGIGNYCHNNYLRDKLPFNEACVDAEIAVFANKTDTGDMCKFIDGDVVQGWVPAGAWWDILGVIASLPTGDRVIPVTVIRDTREFDAY